MGSIPLKILDFKLQKFGKDSLNLTLSLQFILSVTLFPINFGLKKQEKLNFFNPFLLSSESHLLIFLEKSIIITFFVTLSLIRSLQNRCFRKERERERDE